MGTEEENVLQAVIQVGPQQTMLHWGPPDIWDIKLFCRFCWIGVCSFDSRQYSISLLGDLGVILLIIIYGSLLSVLLTAGKGIRREDQSLHDRSCL